MSLGSLTTCISVSIVRKLVPSKIRHLAKDYVKLYPTRHMSRIKLTERKIRYIIRQREKGRQSVQNHHGDENNAQV